LALWLDKGSSDQWLDLEKFRNFTWENSKIFFCEIPKLKTSWRLKKMGRSRELSPSFFSIRFSNLPLRLSIFLTLSMIELI
jgi:hypothetical protein